MKTRFRQTGLTLVELMVVVAVLTVLATVAYPLYTQQAQKSRRTDARVALETVAQAQERYFTMNGRYSAFLSSLQTDTLLDSCTGAQDNDCDVLKGTYRIQSSITGNGASFQISATAINNQIGDGQCRAFTVNQMGTKASQDEYGNVSDCW